MREAHPAQINRVRIPNRADGILQPGVTARYCLQARHRRMCLLRQVGGWVMGWVTWLLVARPHTQKDSEIHRYGYEGHLDESPPPRINALLRLKQYEAPITRRRCAILVIPKIVRFIVGVAFHLRSVVALSGVPISSVSSLTRIFEHAHIGHVRCPIALAASLIGIGR